MRGKYLGICITALCLVFSAQAQGTRDKYGVYHPTEDEIANNKRIAELFRHPTFITLRLASMRRNLSTEEPSSTPSPYTIDEWLQFQLFITQNAAETFVIGNYGGPYYQYRPELSRDGDILPYTKEVQEKIFTAEREPYSGSVASTTLVPGRESRSQLVKLEDWYESPLRAGHYQLSVRKRFVSDGDWVESNPVTFDVIPRKPTAVVPDGVSVRLVPQTAKPQVKGQPYRMGSDDYFDVEVVNDSDQPVRISVIDSFYGNRLQLYKDGKVVPYIEATATLIQSKDSDPRLVELGDLVIPPKTTSQSQGLTLKKWYGALATGLYRITDRRRFEIDGPWTADSPELLFEVGPQKSPGN